MKDEILRALNVPKEAATSMPNLVIKGDEELIIENHRGILVLNEEEIKLETVLGVLSVKGKNLEIKYMSSNTIVLSGRFKGISYEEDKK